MCSGDQWGLEAGKDPSQTPKYPLVIPSCIHSRGSACGRRLGVLQALVWLEQRNLCSAGQTRGCWRGLLQPAAETPSPGASRQGWQLGPGTGRTFSSTSSACCISARCVAGVSQTVPQCCWCSRRLVAPEVVALLPLWAGSCVLLLVRGGWQERLYFFLSLCCFQIQ